MNNNTESTRWINDASRENQKEGHVLSFLDYLKRFEENPFRECRPTFNYLIDMMNYFGKDERGHFKIFQSNHPDAPPVFGQYKTQEVIYQNLKTFQEEGLNNKFLLLVGPNGSAKSSLVRKYIKGIEEYSQTEEGALFTFSWIFPIDQYVKGSLGLTQQTITHDVLTYAQLEDKDISAILPSELKDHPMLLIPKKYRQELLENSFKDKADELGRLKKTYLYKGDLSKRNRMIYDALLKNYKGSHQEVLKHIRVERFHISKRYSNGAVTIEPQMHIDAQMQQITMDRRLASLPPSLQSLNLFQMQGEIIMANRGVLEYSDLLKRPIDTYKYLLMTTETSNLNISGILTELDIFLIGSSNEIHLAAFKQHPDFNSFKGRFNFIKVPYLLDYQDEEKIYHEQIAGLKDRASFEPYSLKTLCLFAVMTRLRPCQSKNYVDKNLSHLVTTINPLEKAMLISNRELPGRIDSESKQTLMHAIDDIINEFDHESLYEGKFGLSPRDLKKMIYKLASNHKHITCQEILDFLTDLINKRSDYDFLNMTTQGDYHNAHRFVMLLKEYNLERFDIELRESLGIVDERSYEDYVKRYILNINAMIKGEKIKNPITGKFEECDEYSIKEFEIGIQLQEDPQGFRSHLISRLGAWYLDNSGKPIVYGAVFPDLVKRLQETFREEQKKFIAQISKNLVYFETENAPLNDKNREEIETIIQNMMKKYHYTRNGALTQLKWLLKERY